MSQIKRFVVALLLVASSTTFAAGFESISEFRQCGKDMNSLRERLDKLESTTTELSGLKMRAISMSASIEMQRPWVSDYNSRMRFNADIQEYNAFITELNRRRRGHNRNIDKHSERVDEFDRSCMNRTVDSNGDAWKEVCKDTNQYSEWCSEFGEN